MDDFNKDKLSFDNAFDFNDVILPSEDIENDVSLLYRHMLKSDTGYYKTSDADTVSLYGVFDYYYSEYNNTPLAKVSEARVFLYPNPTSKHLIFLRIKK